MSMNINKNMSTTSHLGDTLPVDDKNLSNNICAMENYDDAVDALLNELEAFEIGPLLSPLLTMDNSNLKETDETFKHRLLKFMKSTWSLIHKHKNLMRQHEKLKEHQCRILKDNLKLMDHVKRLKQVIQKKENTESEAEERERRLKVKIGNLIRELKQEKEKNLKLKKKIESNDIQHTHELRRIQLNENRLRDQLQRSIGQFVPKAKAGQNLHTENEDKIRLYKKTIIRLEENNSLMLQEINDLKDALSLHACGLELHVESSGSWDNEIKT